MTFEEFKLQCRTIFAEGRVNISPIGACRTFDKLTKLAIEFNYPHRPTAIPDEILQFGIIILMIDTTGQHESFPTIGDFSELEEDLEKYVNGLC